MDTPAERIIKNIVQKWDARKVEASADEKKILDIFNKGRELRLSLHDVMSKTGESESFVKPIVNDLCKKGALYLGSISLGSTSHTYELRNKGIEVYECEGDVFSRIIRSLRRLENTLPDVHVPLLTKQSDVGRISICRYYIKKLDVQTVVNRYDAVTDKHHNIEAVRLTRLGRNLADYLNSKK